MAEDLSRFQNLSFERFRELATDSSLSKYEKIGFPDSYRRGFEERIFADIATKLTNLRTPGKCVLDIGPGVSDIPHALIDLCEANRHTLVLVDSHEMLSQLPDRPFIHKVAGRFPDDCKAMCEAYAGRVDALLSYSVLHYVFAEGRIFHFLDHVLALLADGGQALLGDIPNTDKRRRFFSSPAGIAFHQQFTKTTELPPVELTSLQARAIDDAVVQALCARSRNAGFDAYIVPQDPALPMANRREDILVIRP
jgi:hypothetical protein